MSLASDTFPSLLKIHLCFCLKTKVRKCEKRVIFHLPLNFPSSHNNPSQAMLKTWARNLAPRSFPVNSGTQVLESSTAAFWGPIRRKLESEATGIHSGAWVLDAGISTSGFKSHCFSTPKFSKLVFCYMLCSQFVLLY